MSSPTNVAYLPNAGGSIEERCRHRYGVWHPDLQLSVSPTTGLVTILPHLHNYVVLLKVNPSAKLSYSIFDQAEMLNGVPMTNTMQTQLRSDLSKLLGKSVPPNDLADAISLVAHKNAVNPLEEWFRALPPPEKEGVYLDRWLMEVCGVEDTPINRVLGRKFLISAVARALKPGCYVEGSLIFYGDQGAGKTWLFTNLNPKPEYYSSEELNISNKKEAAAVCCGKFIIELGELNSIRRNELNAMKQYLTATSDTYQPKYKQRAETVPRMHVFGGTTNDDVFLTDPTGNRRFWCVQANGEIKKDLFLSIKQQLWAEALAAFDAGEEWTLTPEERDLLEASNKKFVVEDPLVTYLREALSLRCSNATEVSSYALQHEILSPYREKTHPKAIAQAMKALGWDQFQFTSGKEKGSRGYRRKLAPEFGEVSWDE